MISSLLFPVLDYIRAVFTSYCRPAESLLARFVIQWKSPRVDRNIPVEFSLLISGGKDNRHSKIIFLECQAGDSPNIGWWTAWTTQDWHQASNPCCCHSWSDYKLIVLYSAFAACFILKQQHLSLTQQSYNVLELKGKTKGYLEKCSR